MKVNNHTNRLKLRDGFQWSEHFLAPIILSFIISFVGSSLILNLTHYSDNFLIIFILSCIPIGLGTYYFQLNKLKFKSFTLTKDIESFKKGVRELFLKEGWDIEHDTENYIQTSYNGLFTFDMLTLKYKKNEIQWNVIHHPDAKNTIASLFSINVRGRQMIKKIKASA
ncbi:hypothetical protein [Algoriphagus persicinus]|uniref:hypothetical protein n=1 Tax=Algoriphagus persicinus TaxID=3108754 RepID=UPI002B3851D9|nr:hypothetical protein [Algoriphagus sp. E1-3-M2]MEB2787154.1 hypothetical protein [Algoriphagus sp. E1-3-M2]